MHGGLRDRAGRQRSDDLTSAQFLVSSESPEREPGLGRFARIRMNIAVHAIPGHKLTFCISK